MITAKVLCSHTADEGEGDARSVRVVFTPDYQDGRNQKWSQATPHLHLEMTLRGDVADRFQCGARYTLTFTPEESS